MRFRGGQKGVRRRRKRALEILSQACHKYKIVSNRCSSSAATSLNSRQQTADKRQQIADSRQQRADSRQQTADSRQKTKDSRLQTKDNR
jgi:hypothetical protein